jgi:hypothetical protein
MYVRCWDNELFTCLDIAGIDWIVYSLEGRDYKVSRRGDVQPRCPSPTASACPPPDTPLPDLPASPPSPLALPLPFTLRTTLTAPSSCCLQLKLPRSERCGGAVEWEETGSWLVVSASRRPAPPGSEPSLLLPCDPDCVMIYDNDLE